jgi:hypothetical protein
MSSGSTARLRRLLWNAGEHRPRAPVRLLLATVLVVVVVAVVNLPLAALVGGSSAAVVLFVLVTVGQGAPIPAVLLAGHVVDRRLLADLGLGIDRDWWVDLGFGAALGGALMTGIFGTALAAGWVRVAGTFAVEGLSTGFAGAAALVFGLFLVSGVSEELVARGYLLTNVAEGLLGPLPERAAVAVAVVVSSSLFGLAHAANPNATVLSTLAIGVAGVLLAAGYLLTDELAIPIGLHVTWNLFQGTVYGFGVSGFDFGVSVVDTVETGPDLATGGTFGPEAGLLGLAAEAVGVLAIVGYVRLRYGPVGLAAGVARPALRPRSGDDRPEDG